jgi:hypothetical protein
VELELGRVIVVTLLGWYLVLLPKADTTVWFPVQWSAVQRSFDTAKECEDARAKAAAPAADHSFLCIATDDPRLKGRGGS